MDDSWRQDGEQSQQMIEPDPSMRPEEMAEHLEERLRREREMEENENF